MWGSFGKCLVSMLSCWYLGWKLWFYCEIQCVLLMVNRVMGVCFSRLRVCGISRCLGVMYSRLRLFLSKVFFILCVLCGSNVELRKVVCMLFCCRVFIWFFISVISGDIMMLVLGCSSEGSWQYRFLLLLVGISISVLLFFVICCMILFCMFWKVGQFQMVWSRCRVWLWRVVGVVVIFLGQCVYVVGRIMEVFCCVF